MKPRARECVAAGAARSAAAERTLRARLAGAESRLRFVLEVTGQAVREWSAEGEAHVVGRWRGRVIPVAIETELLVREVWADLMRSTPGCRAELRLS